MARCLRQMHVEEASSILNLQGGDIPNVYQIYHICRHGFCVGSNDPFHCDNR